MLYFVRFSYLDDDDATETWDAGYNMFPTLAGAKEYAREVLWNQGRCYDACIEDEDGPVLENLRRHHLPR